MGNRRSGFTLIEAVVALTIVSMTAVAALATVGTEFRTADRARTALEADALAEQRLMTLSLLPSSALTMMPDSVASGQFPPPFAGYTWAVASHAVQDQLGLFDVSVRVDWGGGSLALASRVYKSSVAAGTSTP